MLIPTADIRDWRDLQDRVANLFREMGYEVLSPHVIKHVRGSKEVDVYVRDPRTSVPHVILIECKHWKSNLPQDVVHGFRTVMADCGANTGIIVGSTGFQRGAEEAVAYTNLELRTWESLQRAYGNEWFLRQKERLVPLGGKLKLKDDAYLDQFEASKTLVNLMRFERTGRLEELYGLLEEGRILTSAMSGGPRSYDQAGPLETHVHEDHPEAVADRHGMPVLQHATVRDWFQWIEQSSTNLLARIDALETEVHQSFDEMDPQDVDAAFEETLARIREETPVRVLRPLLREPDYQRLLDLLADWFASVFPSATK